MIAATVVAIMLLLGMGSGQFGSLMTGYAEDPIKATIKDEKRREMALDSLDKLEDAIEAFNEDVSDDIEKLGKLVRDYDSKPAGFEQFFSAALEQNRKDLNTIWERRSDMLKHIEAEEWTSIIDSARQAAKKQADKS
jgi:hypothetical protein